MKLRFAKLDPSGNTTILVTTPVPRAEQSAIAARLMAGDCLCAEQVGFVEEATVPGARARLQMMGGEFCGNASMSLAALLALEGGLAAGAETDCALEVSGAAELVRCHTAREGEYALRGRAAMPLPEGIEKIEISEGLRAPMVRFPGIAHTAVPEDALGTERAERLLPGLCERLGLDAMGVLFVGEDGSRMRPLVYVRSTESCVWEHGCASGTAALGALAALRRGGEARLNVAQPGGTITVSASCDSGSVCKLEIEGSVRVIATGDVYI